MMRFTVSHYRLFLYNVVNAVVHSKKLLGFWSSHQNNNFSLLSIDLFILDVRVVSYAHYVASPVLQHSEQSSEVLPVQASAR